MSLNTIAELQSAIQTLNNHTKSNKTLTGLFSLHSIRLESNFIETRIYSVINLSVYGYM